MDKCGICLKPAEQLFETGNDGVYACFKCQPLVPEVTIGDSEPTSSEHSNDEIKQEPSEDGTLYCHICQKGFQKDAQLQNHMRNHRAERRFVCTYCNKAFSQSNNLRAHLRIHTNERPYKCQECGKAFTQVTNLNNHVRLHTGERPFVCPEPGCDKAYAQVTNLNQHRKRHLSGRPLESSYQCPVCGEQFAQRNHMYTHRREAHSVLKASLPLRVRFACSYCDVKVATERHLQAHIAQHHSEDPEDDKSSFKCVFASCGAVVSSPRDHTEHLLRAHQLRVLATRARTPPKRGRPPKMMKDPLELNDHEDFVEVKIRKSSPQYMPKLRVQSLFQ
ncbi:gastrula zinc finger protein XlCGF8.2DB-like [Leptidea sinapis]|uniref:gastrula zinc finger protein XlCGF8.2DB-like n=1 Tax=Leptidea sinapis TaxID=189913 RepID=UPI0021440B2B|nr:gastrula zinc finger protein XlCGF8.2DB-like [Leptidea sinapis]